MKSSGALAVAVVLSLTGCRRTPAEAPRGPLRSDVSMADATAGAQLESGFYGIEDHAWRWTAAHFTFELAAPAGADQGARLALDVSVPDSALTDTRSITLACRVGSASLAPETYTHTGQYRYVRPLEPVKEARVRVRCDVDHVLPRRPVDDRELAIIVRNLALEPLPR
ncbi:MAG TPA: hypothetical protein VFF06_14580 [Polyangia bacterium]|nr:hypothetical protein [Polyangia bacterium]